MKRKLQKAYDTMTMPDDCARRIEQRLLLQQEQQSRGHYTRVVSPMSRRNHGWVTAVVAVCLVLVLSTGGTMLFLRTFDAEIGMPTQSAATVHQTVPGDYSLVTDISAGKVEAFAMEVRKNILEEDWETFAQNVQYPIEILDQQITGEGGLVGLFIRNKVNDTFLEELRKESCNQMFCNWQGICMGSGQIWINEVEGALKVTAINGLFADLNDPADYDFQLQSNGFYTFTAYRGRAEAITIPTVHEQRSVMEVGSGSPVIRNGDAVRFVTIPDQIRAINEYAFANCEGLEAVFIHGDAPAEAEGVFDGSENVIVYYPEGSSGWGDTWCGRKTAAFTHLSLGTATLYTEQEMANQKFLEVLRGEKGFFCEDYVSSLTIEEYCSRKSCAKGKSVTVPCFTMVDMDGDGVKELVLWVSIEGEAEDYLILRPGDSEDGWVYTFLEPGQKITDLKKDGSFYHRGNSSGLGQTRAILRDGKAQYLEEQEQTEKPPVTWHIWPCQRPDLVLESYEYASENGWSRLPGTACDIFEGLLKGSAANHWEELRDYMAQWGMTCREKDDSVTVCDPDAPGTVLYGTLTERNGSRQFATLGLYICTEEKEYQAEVRDLLSNDPQYMVDAHLAALGSMGRRVYATEKLLDYLEGKEIDDPLESAASREAERIRILMNGFVESSNDNDAQGIKDCLADEASDPLPEIPFDVKIISYDNVPSQDVGIGERWNIDLVLCEAENPANTHHVSVELVKQEDGWKVLSCELEE